MRAPWPCWNEEATLGQTLEDIPRSIEGIDEVEVLVINDGSCDATVSVARKFGANHVVSHAGHRGLGAAFATGLDGCLSRGADLIVNTDGDNQYFGPDIARLVQPILRGEADIVIGDRQTAHVPYFSAGKRLLQAVGSWIVGRVSGVAVPDAVSGFRAYSRQAALSLNVTSSFSHTIPRSP